MKYLPLIWAGLSRKKARTIFTTLSIVVAFLLFGVLETIDYAFAHPADSSGADRLITTNKYSVTLSLPFSYTEQIRSVPGVADVTWVSWFGGYYQESKNFIFAIPVDADSYLRVHREDIAVANDVVQAFRSTRGGALVKTALMKKYGWKVGDKLPLHSTIWSRKADGSLNWTFDILGTFDSTDASQVLFHYEYFDEGRAFGNGSVGWLEERIADPAQAAEVAKRIDALFANSANETKSQPAKDFILAFIKQTGDIAFVLHAILGAVFFALLFLIGNTLMQSMRERTPELAVLKALGFGDWTIFALLLAESLLLCVTGAIIGVALSYSVLPVVKSVLQGVDLSVGMLLPAIAVALVLALIVGLPPALRARRLPIAEALADKR